MNPVVSICSDILRRIFDFLDYYDLIKFRICSKRFLSDIDKTIIKRLKKRKDNIPYFLENEKIQWKELGTYLFRTKAILDGNYKNVEKTSFLNHWIDNNYNHRDENHASFHWWLGPWDIKNVEHGEKNIRNFDGDRPTTVFFGNRNTTRIPIDKELRFLKCTKLSDNNDKWRNFGQFIHRNRSGQFKIKQLFVETIIIKNQILLFDYILFIIEPEIESPNDLNYIILSKSFIKKEKELRLTKLDVKILKNSYLGETIGNQQSIFENNQLKIYEITEKGFILKKTFSLPKTIEYEKNIIDVEKAHKRDIKVFKKRYILLETQVLGGNHLYDISNNKIVDDHHHRIIIILIQNEQPIIRTKFCTYTIYERYSIQIFCDPLMESYFKDNKLHNYLLCDPYLLNEFLKRFYHKQTWTMGAISDTGLSYPTISGFFTILDGHITFYDIKKPFIKGKKPINKKQISNKKK